MLKKNILLVFICFVAVSPSFAQTIWMSAMKGNISKIEKELANGFDINTQGNSGYTLLFFSVAGKQYKTVDFLIGKGAKPDIKNADGNTPLSYSIIQNQGKMVKLLIDKGANVNQEAGEGYPILIALSKVKGDYSIIEMLYNAGADITVKDSEGHDVRQVMWLRKDKKKIEKLFATPPSKTT